MNAVESPTPLFGYGDVMEEMGYRHPIDPNNIEASAKFLPKEWLTETPPEHEFCVNPLVPMGAVTLLVGHGGTGKSLLALKMAVHIALGLKIVGAETNGGKVAYISLEDSEDIVRWRMFKLFNKLPEDVRQRADELAEKLMIIGRYGLRTHMAVNNGRNITAAPIAEELSALLKEHEIKSVFVDTFIRTHTLQENDNAQMGALLVAFEQVVKEAGCAVVLIHHLPKSADNKSHAAARGASAITDNARSAMLLKIMGDKDANEFAGEDIKLAVSEGRLIELTHDKHNYSAPHPRQYLEMRDGVLLEVFPSKDPHSALEQRYMELYAWWEDKFNRRPLAKSNIGDAQAKEIRPAGTSYGKGSYQNALQAAVDDGYAVKVPAPADGSTNSKAEYYTLFSLEDDSSLILQ